MSERVLVALCDGFVIKTLESVGKAIKREKRSRVALLRGRPLHTAHMMWPLDAPQAVKRVEFAFDALPARMAAHKLTADPARVVLVLTRYAQHLVTTGTAHDVNVMVARLREGLAGE